MKCEYGFCLVCEKQIVRVCGDCSAKKPTHDYTEVQLLWTNGSKMNVAVCVDCSKDAVWKSSKMDMTQAIWDAWDKMHHVYDKGIVLA